MDYIHRLTGGALRCSNKQYWLQSVSSAAAMIAFHGRPEWPGCGHYASRVVTAVSARRWTTAMSRWVVSSAAAGRILRACRSNGRRCAWWKIGRSCRRTNWPTLSAWPPGRDPLNRCPSAVIRRFKGFIVAVTVCGVWHLVFNNDRVLITFQHNY